MAEDLTRYRDVRIDQEMRSAYLDYAMSVIVARALPDVRDGLKPVHRRILYAMNEMGMTAGTKYRKCASSVGEVLKFYHPHGDVAVYDALVRLAQPWALRYPLVDGQGNFGSVDGDPPAAMRYTESRLQLIANMLLDDLDKDTVDFIDNFDGEKKEPTVLPALLPNLLLNGASGIAVGMATNIPPHNLREVVDAITFLIDNPEAELDKLFEFIKGPDFPTGGTIIGMEGVRLGYTHGRGRVIVRAKAFIEEMTAERYQIVVKELPYQVNKAQMIERIADMVREKKIEGISDLRDESDRDGMRVVFELKRDANPRSVLNQLYKHSAMQSTFGMNMLALVHNEPQLLSLKRFLREYILHRQSVVTRRTKFDLEKARARAHILEGFKIALDNLDAAIKTIRESDSSEAAQTALQSRFTLSELQARAVLDMQLRRLAALERKKITDEYAEVIKHIAFLEDLLANPRKIDQVIKDELTELKKKFGDERRTNILPDEKAELTDEDLIADEEVAVTITTRGYIKRVPSSTYRVQRRGGKGITGMITREEDVVSQLVVCRTHDSVLFFTDRGRVFKLKAHEVPDSSRTAKGTPVINLINIEPKERVTALVSVRNFEEAGNYMVLATRKGEIKKTAIKEFSSVRRAGLIAYDIEPGDDLLFVRAIHEKGDVIVASKNGLAARFSETTLRSASRASGGVRGIKLQSGDEAVGMDVVRPGAEMLTITEDGFGKRTPIEEYRTTGRGVQGVFTMELRAKGRKLAGMRVVDLEDELMLITKDGTVIRTVVETIRQTGRLAQGVTVMDLRPGDKVSSISTVGYDNRSEDGEKEAE
ncbi:MAG TPA: DNA gyrase subunit A [Chloroflexota bacterium]|nr:DNA gyrase subunit A [Chloroflexota bacterium]